MMEGTRCTNLGGGPPCNAPSLTAPVAEYTHDDGCSVTGGEIYHGSAVAGSGARYVFADFCNGRTYAIAAPPNGAAKVEVGTAGFNVSAFGRDEWGEVYLADFGGGRVMRLGAAVTLGTVPVVEFHRAAGDHYFVTLDPLEVAGLDDGTKGGWARTGLGFRAWTSAVDGAIPICRFYLPPGDGDSHFFSADPAECARVQAGHPGIVLESTAAMYVKAPDPVTGACADPQTQPVYRVWIRGTGDSNHRYTTSIAVRDQMVAAGGAAEGYGPDAVAMCAPR
jgi:hypothetical protein